MSAEPLLNRAPEPDSGSVSGRALGAWIRRSRSAQSLSLRALAARTGFSPSFISQVENGVVSPSIASMEKIGHALGATLIECFAEACRGAAHVIVRPAERVQVSTSWLRAQVETLAPRTGARLEPLVVTLDPGGRSAERPYAHTMEEFAFVLAGRPTLTVGSEEHELRPSDAVTIEARELRCWENRTAAPVKILSLYYAK
jgi:transcriptional regulator with XRE-family HTH domain